MIITKVLQHKKYNLKNNLIDIVKVEELIGILESLEIYLAEVLIILTFIHTKFYNFFDPVMVFS